MGEINNIYLDKVLEIETVINRAPGKHLGLHTGEVGRAFFYAGLYSVTSEEIYRTRFLSTVDGVLEGFGSHELLHTFRAGYTGIAWGINRFVGSGLLEADVDVLFEDLDSIIYGRAAQDLETGLYDFMYGGGGAALYALGRLPNVKAEAFLFEYIDCLDRIKREDTRGYKWVDTFQDMVSAANQETPRYGLGLAHGIPGIVCVLLKIHQGGIRREQTSRLIEHSLHWLQHCRLPDGVKNSLYPSWLHGDVPDDRESRLGWCYGDLGIAYMFLQAGKVLNNADWVREGFDILSHALKRRNPDLNRVMDAGFCHGASGVAHMLRMCYALTGIEACKEAYKYWLEQTLAMARFDDGLAGYKTLKISPRDGAQIWINDETLIEGVTGIGLVLLGELGDVRGWDESFLLWY